MKLFKLTRTDSVDYDEYDSFVVRAKNEKEARDLLQKEHSYDTWPNGSNVTCEVLRNKGDPEIIIGSFNAG